MSAISQVWNSVVDYGHRQLFKLRDMRNDPLAFQKTFQVAYSAIQLGNMHYNTNYLGKFSSVAQAVYMHDFYLIVKEPREFFLPVNVDRIKAPALLANLETALRQQLSLTLNSDAAIQDFAKTMLKNQLEDMAKNKDAYRSEKHFLDALENRLKERGTVEEVHPHREILNGYVIPVRGDRSNLNLSALAVPLVSKSIIEGLVQRDWSVVVDRLIHLNWGIVNVLCVGSFFKAWNLLDTAKYAASLGQSRASDWVRNQCLETWLRAGVCTGFLITLCRDAYKLMNTVQPTDEEKSKMRRDTAVAAFEVAYQGLGLFNHMKILPVSAGIIHLAALITKGFGIWVLVENSKFKPNYFPNPAAV